MKKITLILSAFLLAFAMFSSCDSNSEQQKNNANNTEKQESQSSNDAIKKEINKSNSKSSSTSYSVKIDCSQTETNENGVSSMTKSCLYNNYKAVARGATDSKGRYAYQYELFVKKGGEEYTPIKNAEMFNKEKELLALINGKIKKDYESYANDPQTKSCFDGKPFTPFTFDQLGISFDSDKISFNASFGLSSACMSVDGSIVSFDWGEMQTYIKP
ncbi:MAG: hypothetical protein EAZ55_11125 [Cytophagales bacterium]|nr:MAG: hypothetical protein EAZ55_11125 [Cytophagales bacterium]